MRRSASALVAALLCVAGTTAAADPPGNPTPRNPVLPWVEVKAAHTIKPGQYADIAIDSGNFGGDGFVAVTWGDHSGGLGSATWDTGCYAVAPGLTQPTMRLRHAYRYPGDYTVRFEFTPECVAEPVLDVPPQPYVGTGTATVMAGPKAPSNGPERPYLFMFGLNSGPYARVNQVTKFQGIPWDEDGYMTRLVYRWGDGTQDTTYSVSLRQCVDPADHWPRTAYAGDDHPNAWDFPTHRYTRRGWYTATATIVTTGCDGKNAQVGKQSIRFQVK